MTTEQFIDRANAKHDYKYDYSNSEYINRNTKINIICSKHGEFLQDPYTHLSGSGCPKCGGERIGNSKRLDFNTFLDRANKTHDFKYDYSLVEYANTNTKVKIICPIHGIFEQIPHDHLDGRGCYQCGAIKCHDWRKINTKKFIERASKLYDSFFNYDKSICETAQDKVIITCPVHGDFEQYVREHLKGRGCKQCNKYKYYAFSKNKYTGLNKVSNFYLLLMSNEDELFIKLGMTVKKLHRRYEKRHPYKITKLLFFPQDSGFVWDLENYLKRILKPYRYIPQIKFPGYTECFNMKAILDIPDLILSFKNNYIE